MNEVIERINELKRMQEISKRKGFAVAENWFFGELAEMKVVLKRNEKALAGTRA